ncbi:protein of unknown function [Streptococcus thermophilus]|nr:protein of unknown function [Streptococcus thermophilus]
MSYYDLSLGARVQQSPLLSLEEKNRHSFYSWKMDETYINIKGRWHYLYRAIDADGLTLDI